MIKTENQGRKSNLHKKLIPSITQSPVNHTKLAELADLACIVMNKSTDLDNTSINTPVGEKPDGKKLLNYANT